MKEPAFWYGPPGAVARILTPASMVYAAMGGLLSARQGVRAPVPVICVGNVVAGGTGKTPLTLAILALLHAKGRHPHVLTRGYGGQRKGPARVDTGVDTALEVGDEPLLLARAAPTWIGGDRGHTARLAVDNGADVLVMDDGLQNPSLNKDLSILAIDGARGFGNGRVHPSGPLREPLSRGLARARAAVIQGPDRTGARQVLEQAGLRVLSARIEPVGEPSIWHGRRVLAFAGLGRPSKLFDTLAGLGAELVETASFPDHHPYQESEIRPLLDRARDLDAVPVTTAKDHLRLGATTRAGVEVLDVRLVLDDPDTLLALIEAVVAEPRRPEP